MSCEGEPGQVPDTAAQGQEEEDLAQGPAKGGDEEMAGTRWGTETVSKEHIEVLSLSVTPTHRASRGKGHR